MTAPRPGADQEQDTLSSLIGEVLARRDHDTRYRSNVARGLHQATEHYAYPWVLRYITREKDQAAFLRAAGLVANYRNIPHARGVPLGVSLRRLSVHRSGKRNLDPAEPDSIASRLAVLADQDLEQAVSTIRRFLDLAGGSPVSVDYFAIARTLSRWGNGMTEASQAVRRKTIGDYYGAWTYDAATNPSATSASQEPTL